MKAICFYFQVHQPFRYRRYRFFDIGNDHYYYDDYANETILRKVADHCYLPVNKLMLELINKYKGKFKVAFSITGVALEQFEMYAPEVLESFQELAKTGQVEFLAETYSHSLVALKSKSLFQEQVTKHCDAIQHYFGQRPTVFRNTEMVYSDDIGVAAAEMGFQAVLTEGAKHILGWKSPNFLYCNAVNPRLKVLMRNYKLSDDMAFRFSNQAWNEYPLTPEKLVGWMNGDSNEEIFNLFMDYETFGEHQSEKTGIFRFLEELPDAVFKQKDFVFATPSEIIEEFQPVSAVSVPHAISWADEERDLTAWLGNEMQQEAFDKLYAQLPKMNRCTDSRLLKDWNYLQCSDHFYYMCTKFFSDGDVHAYFNPYETPYEAFINYMNVLSDFAIRLNAAVPFSSEEKELANLSGILEERDQKIKKLEEELQKLRSRKRTNTSGKTSRSAGTASTAASTKGKKAQKSAAKTKSKK